VSTTGLSPDQDPTEPDPERGTSALENDAIGGSAEADGITDDAIDAPIAAVLEAWRESACRPVALGLELASLLASSSSAIPTASEATIAGVTGAAGEGAAIDHSADILPMRSGKKSGGSRSRSFVAKATVISAASVGISGSLAAAGVLGRPAPRAVTQTVQPVAAPTATTSAAPADRERPPLPSRPVPDIDIPEVSGVLVTRTEVVVADTAAATSSRQPLALDTQPRVRSTSRDATCERRDDDHAHEDRQGNRGHGSPDDWGDAEDCEKRDRSSSD
jgi:hypothetical protein